jgi:hypothetical protein
MRWLKAAENDAKEKHRVRVPDILLYDIARRMIIPKGLDTAGRGYSIYLRCLSQQSQFTLIYVPVCRPCVSRIHVPIRNVPKTVDNCTEAGDETVFVTPARCVRALTVGVRVCCASLNGVFLLRQPSDASKNLDVSMFL